MGYLMRRAGCIADLVFLRSALVLDNRRTRYNEIWYTAGIAPSTDERPNMMVPAAHCLSRDHPSFSRERDTRKSSRISR